jgi:glycerophosphoryl diester phosphodiesterase
MASFRGAVEVGAHALETDIHLTKDGEVVLSHVRAPGLAASRALELTGHGRTPRWSGASGGRKR